MSLPQELNEFRRMVSGIHKDSNSYYYMKFIETLKCHIFDNPHEYTYEIKTNYSHQINKDIMKLLIADGLSVLYYDDMLIVTIPFYN